MNKIEREAIKRYEEILAVIDDKPDSRIFDLILTYRVALFDLRRLPNKDPITANIIFEASRSLLSVISNIAEGSAKGGDQLINYLRIARGSSAEAYEQLVSIPVELYSPIRAAVLEGAELLDELSREQVVKAIKTLKETSKT